MSVYELSRLISSGARMDHFAFKPAHGRESQSALLSGTGVGEAKMLRGKRKKKTASGVS